MPDSTFILFKMTLQHESRIREPLRFTIRAINDNKTVVRVVGGTLNALALVP
jgi:hypothetical protein